MTAAVEITRRTLTLIAERCPALVQLSTGVGPGVSFEASEEANQLRC